MGDFTHFDEQGNAVMVDVHAKDDTYRVAVATGKIKVSQEVYEAITNHTAKKGDVLGVAAAAIWGVYSICSRKIAGFGYDTIITTRRTFFYGILFMLCALPFMDFHLSLSALLKPVNLGNIIYLGVGASAICFVTWNYAVKSLGATRASVYIYGIPVVTILMSIPLLHEVITFQAMAGTVLTLVGLLISEWPFSPKK